jgi:hypothetical protein
MKKSNLSTLVFLAIALAICAGLFASTNPDGLENVSKVLGFEHKAGNSPGIFIDYTVSAIKHPSFSTMIAGIFGILLIVFAFHSIIHLKHVVVLLAKLMKAEKKDNDVE